MSMLPIVIAMVGIPLLIYVLAFRGHRRDARAGLDVPPVVSVAVRVWAYERVLVPLIVLATLAAIAASYFLYVGRMSPAERDAFLQPPRTLQQDVEEWRRIRREQAVQQHPDSDPPHRGPKAGAAP
jgi:hypothetical protein